MVAMVARGTEAAYLRHEERAKLVLRSHWLLARAASGLLQERLSSEVRRKKKKREKIVLLIDLFKRKYAKLAHFGIAKIRLKQEMILKI